VGTTISPAVKDVDLATGAADGQAPPLLAALSGQWHRRGRRARWQDVSTARLTVASRAAQARTPTRRRFQLRPA
jgi:hypothetical protein